MLGNPTLDTYSAPKENYTYGICTGIGVGILCAAAWTAITLITGYQLGIIAIAVGFLIGKAMGYAGRGASQQFGYVSATVAVLSILLGNILILPAFISREYSVSFQQALSVLTAEDIFAFLKDSSSPMDLVFIAIAAYEAYRFSFREAAPVEAV